MTYSPLNNIEQLNHGAAALRISLGAILLAHGMMKIISFGVAGTVGYFASIGLPAITAYLTIFGEVAGGMALIAGLYTRLTALLSIPILAGATWVHAGNGWVFSNQGGGWEFPALLLALAVIVAWQGTGAFAIRGFKAIDGFVPTALRA